jgi:hypothetical protein
MKSLISRFLPNKRKGVPAQHIRLCLARFRHLLHQYGQITALCTDAADKQSGQYVFDNAYPMALIDRAFEAIEGMIYDLNALAGQGYLGLYQDVEAIRREAGELFRMGYAPSPAAANDEEPEYRLLRKVRELLCRPECRAASLKEGPAMSSFFGVVQLTLQAAGDSIVGLTRSSEFPPLAEAPFGASFPICTSIVDLVSMLGESNTSFPRNQPIFEDSVPAREFLSAFFSPSIWKDNCSIPRQSASLVSCQLEESMNTVIVHGGGYDLFDVFLSHASEANCIYCRFPRVPAPSLVEGILTRLGFFVTSTERGLTGRIAAQSLSETTTKLKMIAKLSAFLLQPSSVAVKHTEEDVFRFIGMHG